MSVDEIITQITEAVSMDAAYEIARTVPRKLLVKVADQLYVEYEGHGTEYIRWAIVKEARA